MNATRQDRTSGGPLEAYRFFVEIGELKPDVQQEQAAERLQVLHDELAVYEARRHTGSLFKRIFSKRTVGEGAPQGVYLYGDVGRGKSMIMDLFFDTAPVASKRRSHSHDFMQDCHDEIHRWRQLSGKERRREMGSKATDDPIPPLADKIARDAHLLCFDEFQVTDVADAMLLGRLFEALFARGVVVVATSNRMPDDLYEGGLNRQLFLPFIDMLKDRLDMLELTGPTDYRLDRIKGVPTYYSPVDEDSTNALRAAFFKMTDRDVEDADSVPSEELEVKGRKLFVPKSSKGVAVFSFKRLCANPLGPADFLAIAWRFHTVFVVAIPQLSADKRNEAKRFVTLIDTLYENNVKLFCSAAVSPQDLYPAGDGAFEFSRTVSRLEEMQSEAYLARGHGVQQNNSAE